jgi:hypothetical protein
MFIPTIIPANRMDGKMKVKIRKNHGGQSVPAEGRYGRGRNFFSWCQCMTSCANEYLQQRYSIFE